MKAKAALLFDGKYLSPALTIRGTGAFQLQVFKSKFKLTKNITKEEARHYGNLQTNGILAPTFLPTTVKKALAAVSNDAPYI